MGIIFRDDKVKISEIFVGHCREIKHDNRQTAFDALGSVTLVENGPIKLLFDCGSPKTTHELLTSEFLKSLLTLACSGV